MNQKELNEIRRRFRLDKNNFSRIFGCYVNSNREVISWIDASLGLMRQEEQEMYLGLLKKTLSGTLGRNLIDIEFSTAQVADSDEHRLHGSRTPLRFSQIVPIALRRFTARRARFTLGLRLDECSFSPGVQKRNNFPEHPLTNHAIWHLILN